MKCKVTSNRTHDVLISKEVTSNKSYKEICSGEPKKVNLGYIIYPLYVENNSLLHVPNKEDNQEQFMYGKYTTMPWDWEILSKFFSIHNIEHNWLDCNSTYGWFDEDLGGWTGCMGKV